MCYIVRGWGLLAGFTPQRYSVMQGTRAERKRDFALCAWGMKPSSDSQRSMIAKQFRFVIWTVAGVVEMDAAHPIVIGRMPSPHGNLLDLTPYQAVRHGISRHHAIIRFEEDGYTLEDLNSTNGTFINHFRVEAPLRYPLKHRDELRFGQLTMQILFVR
ncbi:MAG: FHA domain-containing protein [Anaerolineae bacterium]|nr:FHA domain-containing protein [Anaerolineae bacterium]